MNGARLKPRLYLRKKRKGSLVLALLLLTPGLKSAGAADISSSYAIVADAENGAVYYEQNADTPLAPASMTKVMTVFLMYEEMEKGAMTKDTLITADADDEAASHMWDAINVPLSRGCQYSADELIGAIMVPSACAAAAMVGKYIDGSEEEFARHMTKRAGELGLDAYFEDASGLSDNNRITPRSMAKLGILLINRYPDVLDYTSKSYTEFAGKTYGSTNKLLPGAAFEYEGADGIKTGTTTLAGACLVAAARRDGFRLVSVVMKSGGGSARFRDTASLLDIGFEEAALRRNNIYPTDLSVFVNGLEMPAFIYKGAREPQLLVIAEDLSNYGFNTRWDSSDMTFFAEYDPLKKPTPLDMTVYDGYDIGLPLLPIYPQSGLSVTIDCGGEKRGAGTVYNLGGYIAVSADELGEFAAASFWDNESRGLYIEF